MKINIPNELTQQAMEEAMNSENLEVLSVNDLDTKTNSKKHWKIYVGK